MGPARLPVALVVLGALLLPAPPAAAQDPPRRLRVEVAEDASILVRGEYPPVSSSCVNPVQPVLHERYRGAVEVLRGDDGSLTLIGELRFEHYLKGIAEVPRSWPMEALKAQVVAARSYAASQLEREGDYHLCATDACQVYLGMGVEKGAFGRRWVRAVEETEGQVLLHRGEPAQTFYFSTSNGRTYTNEEVWGSAALPYLPANREEDDGESPLSRWRVEVPFDDLERFLRRDGAWSGGAIRRVQVREGYLAVQGRRAKARLTKAELRDALNDTARCLMPGRYPTPDREGEPLPQTVPSRWFRVRTHGQTLVLEGRGWGHGIGLVQWGAKGKADRGLSYGDILAFYYGGLRPQPYDLPGTIRVLLAAGLRSVTIAPEGESTVRLRGRDQAPPPPLRVTPRAKGLRVRATAPPAPRLEVQGFGTARRAEAGRALRARVTTGAAVRVRAEYLRGDELTASSWRSFEGGEMRFRLGVPVAPGPAQVRLRVTDGVDTVLTSSRPVLIEEGEVAPAPTAAPSPPAREREAAPVADGGAPWVPAAVAAAAALALGVVLTMRRGKGLHRP